MVRPDKIKVIDDDQVKSGASKTAAAAVAAAAAGTEASQAAAAAFDKHLEKGTKIVKLEKREGESWGFSVAKDASGAPVIAKV
jgi:hypothetical protein